MITSCMIDSAEKVSLFDISNITQKIVVEPFFLLLFYYTSVAELCNGPIVHRMFALHSSFFRLHSVKLPLVKEIKLKLCSLLNF